MPGVRSKGGIWDWVIVRKSLSTEKTLAPQYSRLEWCDVERNTGRISCQWEKIVRPRSKVSLPFSRSCEKITREEVAAGLPRHIFHGCNAAMAG